MNPLVSICIPAYNASKYIRDTLISISNQSWKNLEVIVGDNASTDNTLDIVKEYCRTSDDRVRFYKNTTNLGYSGNCNKLIKEANGEYIAIFHADDIYEPEIVKTQVGVLNKNPQAAGCFTGFQFIDHEGNELKIKKGVQVKYKGGMIEFCYKDFIDFMLDFSKNPFCCPSSMIRKQCYIEAGGYDENIKFIEDQDMWIKLLKNKSLIRINKKLINYRLHPAQGSSVYSDPNISSPSPMIIHLEQHLKKSSDNYDEQYLSRINRLYSIDYIQKAYLSVNNSGYDVFRSYIHKSKNYYCFKVFERRFYRYALFQWLPNKLLFYLLKVKLK